jgi:hypothetical protein
LGAAPVQQEDQMVDGFMWKENTNPDKYTWFCHLYTIKMEVFKIKKGA